ncbi:winged helix DNA-binding protein, partial [Bifidobacterium longum]|nr:winged helix DNA-binding protein [Bifidobacterium longum]
KMLQRMEKAGLIVRKTANQDRRSKIVALTPQTKKLANTAEQYLKMRQQRLEKRFSPQQLAIFEQILAYLQDKS